MISSAKTSPPVPCRGDNDPDVSRLAKEIDKPVYELCNLPPEEIEIAEGAEKMHKRGIRGNA